MRRAAPIASVIASLLVFAAITIHASTKPDQPELTLRVNKAVAFAPAKLVLTGQLKGGSDSAEDFYCTTAEWDWGDDTISSAGTDCEPFEAGKTTIRRMYITEHVFKHGGNYAVRLSLKKHNRVVATAVADLQITAALGEDIIR